MNSKSLQAKFPEVYREFFSKCPIVVSAPGDFFWSGEHSILYGGLAIKQHLPLRVYVGLEPSNLPGLTIDEILAFVPSRFSFEPWATSAIKKKEVIEFLNQWLKNSRWNTKKGFKINAIHEVPTNCALDSSGACSAALTTALFLASNLTSSKIIDRWNQLPVCQLFSDKDFDQIFRTAWKIDYLARSGFATGAPCFIPLAHSPFPIVYFTDKKTEEISNLDIIDQKKYFGFRIDELVNLGATNHLDLGAMSEWPIDFGLIYSGDVGHTESTLKSFKEVEWYLNDLFSMWRKILPKLNLPEDKILFSKIVKNPRFKIIEPYVNALTTISLETFYGLAWVLSYGSSEQAIRYLLRTINYSHKLLAPLNVSSPILDELCFLVDKYVRDLGDDFGAGCKLTGAGKRGDILFVVNYHGLRDQIFELISELRKETKENIWLDYASWIDGLEEEGVRVEQHLAEGIYSKFISEGSISLKNFTKEGVIQTEITSLEDFEKEKPKIDVLLDAIENNIYIRGEKLTSKEIPSSSTTMEILGILLDNLGKSISNSKLPESSYSQDRNEMQSKIISPLVKIIKAKTKKTLPFKVSGGLTDFKIKLDPSDLDIRILNKIF